jgi:phage regulator Rha-like protein
MTAMNLNNQPNVNNSSVMLAAQPSEMGVREMSSLQIADITGKQHSHVMRDIRNMVENLKKSNESTSGLVDYSKDYHREERNQYKYLSEKTQKAILDFAFEDNTSPYIVEESSYKDEKGELRTMYLLNKKASLLLASGYSVTLRAKIIDRWEALETGQAEPMYHQPKQEQLTMKDKMNAATWAAKFLNLNDASKLLMAQQILAPTGLILPEYTSSKGFLLSADKLLKYHGINLTSRAFNLAMEDKGLVTYRERPSKSKGVKRFPILTEKGLKYGENQVHPKCQQQTQIRYYEDKFAELLKELNLV